MAARRRHDPVSRPADGYVGFDRIDNQDPERRYVLTNPNDAGTGTDAYVARGWEIELQRPGGPRAALGRTTKEGDAITSGGQILVSRPRAEVEAEEAIAQSRCDLVDRRILKDGNIEDGLRGQGFALGVDRRATAFEP